MYPRQIDRKGCRKKWKKILQQVLDNCLFFVDFFLLLHEMWIFDCWCNPCFRTDCVCFFCGAPLWATVLKRLKAFWALNMALPDFFLANVLAGCDQSGYALLNEGWWQASQNLPFSAWIGRRFFFVYFHLKPVCFTCNATVTLEQEGSLERHFKTVHENRRRGFSAKKRVYAPQMAWCAACSRAVNFNKWKTRCKAVTITSCRVRHVLAKHKKSFKGGDIVNEAFLEAAEQGFDDIGNKT